MLHLFKIQISQDALPGKFTYPFHYTPHPLCMAAAEEVQTYLANRKEWENELKQGKMFGVLIVRTTSGDIGYLAAFSGILAGSNVHPYFVPPVYDLLQPDGFFKIEEENITALNMRIKEVEESAAYQSSKQKLAATIKEAEKALASAKENLKAAKEARDKRRNRHPDETELAAMIRESQFQKAEYKRLEHDWKERIACLKEETGRFTQKIEALKAERKSRSAALQQQLFKQFRMLNNWGQARDLCDLFTDTIQKTPPAGAGECAAPKLLQYAYLHQLQPIAMAEFWWGTSPKAEIRHHGYYYPACKGKCEPILRHMLQGLDVEDNPLQKGEYPNAEPEIVYEDEWMVAVNKPAGMLSVPGKGENYSVRQWAAERYPEATGPLIVHRLDMATSGLLLIAKTKEVHQHLQAQFKNRTVKKRYIALVDGLIPYEKGTISLPLCPAPLDRPRQIVNQEFGKPAVTDYEVLSRQTNYTRLAFYPLTGRTHQLRVHAAHPLGLNCPIVGDPLYGKAAERLYLHAESIEFKHPVTKQTVLLKKVAEF